MKVVKRNICKYFIPEKNCYLMNGWSNIPVNMDARNTLGFVKKYGIKTL